MLRIGTKPKPRAAPMKAKTTRRRAAPEMAKKKFPETPPAPEKPATKFKKIEVAGEGEAEDRHERYLNRYPDKAMEVWIRGKLSYRVYGPEHPLTMAQLTETGQWMRGIHKRH